MVPLYRRHIFICTHWEEKLVQFLNELTLFYLIVGGGQIKCTKKKTYFLKWLGGGGVFRSFSYDNKMNLRFFSKRKSQFDPPQQLGTKEKWLPPNLSFTYETWKNNINFLDLNVKIF